MFGVRVKISGDKTINTNSLYFYSDPKNKTTGFCVPTLSFVCHNYLILL